MSRAALGRVQLEGPACGISSGFWSPALIVIAMPCVRFKRHPDSSDEMRPVFAPPHPVLRRLRALSSPLRLLELHCLPLVLV
jgi:hypothetical protein